MSATIAKLRAQSDTGKRAKPKAQSKATQDGFAIRKNKHKQFSLVKLASEQEDSELLVSGAVRVIGKARNGDSGDWHNVVIYVDQDGNERQWLMPMGLLAGDRTEAIRELLQRGLFIASGTKAKAALFNYLHYGENVRYRTIYQSGWHGDRFVMQDGGVIGAGEESLLLINPEPAIQKVGSLDSWREQVAHCCQGNSRLAFAVSAALAAPLLEVAGVEGGGVHFVGATSIGKTRALTVGSTVFGGSFTSWRATVNGLEGVAAKHNHKPLIIDEIGESNPREAGNAIYMLSNGTGKTRANRNGTSREPVRFRLLAITSGEKTLCEHMQTAGRGAMAGQEIRLLNIEADAGMNMGLFENIHDSKTPQEFADLLTGVARHHSGHAGPAFVRYVIDNRKHCLSNIKEIADSFQAGCRNADSQVQRAATRFALIAAAGDLATKAGITGWAEGEAINSALTCFNVWRNSWTPTGSREHEKSIEQVRGWLQVNEARFKRSDNEDAPNNCAGLSQNGEHWIFPSVFRDEVCGGIRQKTVTDALLKFNYLKIDESDTENRRNKRCSIDGKQQRVYVICGSIFDESGDHEN